ncbi:hypothetical protein LCGC14_1102740 [marine sediment metagenome]|uniref:Uncharacterized protein n=1 Tax=marine sediment metagenome TaxID=412755 RepID=A0A0F9MDJ3_9ZZZZ
MSSRPSSFCLRFLAVDATVLSVVAYSNDKAPLLDLARYLDHEGASWGLSPTIDETEHPDHCWCDRCVRFENGELVDRQGVPIPDV